MTDTPPDSKDKEIEMPTLAQILYGFFILVCIVLIGWILLEAIDRLNEAAVRLPLAL